MKYDKIINFYGPVHQLDLVQEECAELIQAVAKYKRIMTEEHDTEDAYYLDKQQRAVDTVLLEVADVEIMLEQLKRILDFDEDIVADVIKFKLDRTISRM